MLGENTRVPVGVCNARACLAECIYSANNCFAFVSARVNKPALDKNLLYQCV
jgi:hypothetical protein